MLSSSEAFILEKNDLSAHLVKTDEINLVKRLNQLKCSGLFRLQLNIDNIDSDMVVVCCDKIQIHNELNRLVGKHTHL